MRQRATSTATHVNMLHSVTTVNCPMVDRFGVCEGSVYPSVVAGASPDMTINPTSTREDSRWCCRTPGVGLGMRSVEALRTWMLASDVNYTTKHDFRRCVRFHCPLEIHRLAVSVRETLFTTLLTQNTR